MPHKRNPDVFELTRARAAALDGDLAVVLHLKGKLTSGYHRDVQLLKEPLLRGLRRTAEMLDMLTLAVPQLAVDVPRCLAAVQGDLLATDEVMRRVEKGVPFRTAYREVAAELKQGRLPPRPDSGDALLRRRGSTGGAGNLGLALLRRRLRKASRFTADERARFDAALSQLTGGASWASAT
jgi:argininosuccinate lyase